MQRGQSSRREPAGQGLGVFRDDARVTGWPSLRGAALRALWIPCVALGMVLSACAPSRPDPAPALPPSPEDQLIQALERARPRGPVDPLWALEISSAYLDRARSSLIAGDPDGYVSDLARAQAVLLPVTSAYPRLPAPHNQLGILAAYGYDLEGARAGFRTASGLDPRDPLYQLNLAEVAVYQGRLAEARGHTEAALQRGVEPAEAQLIDVLIAWKEGDLVEARDRFRDAAQLDPERVRVWNGATSIDSFEDMAAHCCLLPFCGPHLEQACQDIGLAVATQERDEETLLRTLRLEIERAQQRRQLERGVNVRVPEPDGPAGAERSGPAR